MEGGRRRKAAEALLDLGLAYVDLHCSDNKYDGAWLDKKIDALISIAKDLKLRHAIPPLDYLKERPRLQRPKGSKYCILDCAHFDDCDFLGYYSYAVARPPKTNRDYLSIKRDKNTCKRYVSARFGLKPAKHNKKGVAQRQKTI
jgi:hypothetical protein